MDLAYIKGRCINEHGEMGQNELPDFGELFDGCISDDDCRYGGAPILMRKVGGIGMKAKMTISLILLILFVLPACGQGTNSQGMDVRTTAPEDANAVALYKISCLSCHAADLSGRVGPSLQEIGSKLSQEQLSTIIHDGARGMPAFQKSLSNEEIDALTQWLSKNK